MFPVLSIPAKGPRVSLCFLWTLTVFQASLQVSTTPRPRIHIPSIQLITYMKLFHPTEIIPLCVKGTTILHMLYLVSLVERLEVKNIRTLLSAFLRQGGMEVQWRSISGKGTGLEGERSNPWLWKHLLSPFAFLSSHICRLVYEPGYQTHYSLCQHQPSTQFQTKPAL